MTNDPQTLTAAYWYSKFRLALSEKDFTEAEAYFQKFQYWKRRMKVNDMLTEICERVAEGNHGR